MALLIQHKIKNNGELKEMCKQGILYDAYNDLGLLKERKKDTSAINMSDDLDFRKKIREKMIQTANLHNVYLALGSNIGNKKKNINNALENINQHIGSVIETSSLYETEPIGFSSENLFLNAVCLVQTELTPIKILEKCQTIEKELGRKTKSVNQIYTDRSIDIDILLYDNKIVESSQLTIPHPHMHEREFVLHPLSEIAPSVIHPILGKNIRMLKNDLDKNT